MHREEKSEEAEIDIRIGLVAMLKIKKYYVPLLLYPSTQFSDRGGFKQSEQLLWQVKTDRSNNQLLRGKFGEVLRGRLADDEEKKILCEKDLRLVRISLVSIS
jgi:hypothetical protein